MVPTMESTWESWFDSRDFARGLDYFQDGRVKLRDADASGWRAFVDGAERYSVHLACDELGYASPGADMTSCTCPRFADGYLCKHVAATCAAVEAADVSSFERKAQSMPNAVKLANSISAEECKSFLVTILRTDAKWAREFMNHFGELDVSRACDDLTDDFENIVDEHSRYGFVGWNESLSCEFAICNAIMQAVEPFMERGLYDEVMDLTEEALSLIRSIEIDDSNGFYGSTADTCISIWRKVANTSAAGENLVVRRGVAFCLAPEDDDPERAEIQSYQVDDVESFLIARFADNAAASEFIMSLARDRMRDEPSPNSPYAEYRRRERQRWMVVNLRAMKAAGRSFDECMDAAASFIGSGDVAVLLADYAEESGDRARAIELLEAGKAEAPDSDAAKMTKCLLTLYRDEGDEDAQERCLRELVSYSREGEAGDYYLQLKNGMEPARWRKERKAVLQSARNDQCRHECLAAEGATADLWKEVSKAGFYELSRFEEALASDYADQIADVYHDKLLDDLTYANTRKSYQRTLKLLARIGNLPGCASRASEIGREIERLYPKRSALLDELSKLDLG